MAKNFWRNHCSTCQEFINIDLESGSKLFWDFDRNERTLTSNASVNGEWTGFVSSCADECHHWFRFNSKCISRVAKDVFNIDRRFSRCAALQ